MNHRQRGNLLIGMVLIGLGILFLAGQVAGLSVGRYLWPFFVIVPGLMFFVGMALGGRWAGPLAIPGSIITTVGLILLYQNTTGHWQRWSYAWALIVVAVGVGLMIGGSWSRQPKMVTAGKDAALAGFIMFLIFGAFFELVLNISGLGLSNTWWWPVVLIIAGVLMIIRRLLPFGGHTGYPYGTPPTVPWPSEPPEPGGVPEPAPDLPAVPASPEPKPPADTPTTAPDARPATAEGQ